MDTALRFPARNHQGPWTHYPTPSHPPRPALPTSPIQHCRLTQYKHYPHTITQPSIRTSTPAASSNTISTDGTATIDSFTNNLDQPCLARNVLSPWPSFALRNSLMWRKHVVGHRLAPCGRQPYPTRTVTTAAAAALPAAAVASSSSWSDILAVLLGYGCVAGSCFRSVPQIGAILSAGSAEGLSLTSNVVELLCFTVTVTYNIQQGYAFNTYGEVFACWIQDLVIVGLIFKYMRLSVPVVLAAATAFAALCGFMFSPWFPLQVLAALQLSTIVVMAVGARMPQIILNLRRGNAGVLSPLTCGLNVAGCLVRVFTTLVLTRDTIILGGCVTQLLLNSVLLYQSIATPGIKTAPGPASTSTTPPSAAPLSAAASTALLISTTDAPLGGTTGAVCSTQLPTGVPQVSPTPGSGGSPGAADNNDVTSSSAAPGAAAAALAG